MCTAMRISAADKSVVVGRSMEFPILMDAQLTVIPRGIELSSLAPNGETGLTWTTKYGALGVDAFAEKLPGGDFSYTDGMNEKGVYIGLLYHPGFCVWSPSEGKANSELLTPLHVIAYLLTTCSNVAEAKAALQGVTVWNYEPPVPVKLMAHFGIYDSTGASLVAEWDNGALKLFDNPIGVLTNSPNFDWHLTNLRNYVNLKADPGAAVSIAGLSLAPLGMGSGMRGLPGDPTPPARFVRAAALVATAKQQPDSAPAENMMLHLINNFDLVDGISIASLDPPAEDQTLWSTISNLTDHTFSVRTATDVTFRKIDLETLDFTGSKVIAYDLPGPTAFPKWTL